MTTEQQSVPGHGQGGGQNQPITASPYVTIGGDSLPSIAERCGHAGEWAILADANRDHVWGDYNNIQPGLEIVIPPEWLGAQQTKPAGGKTR